LVVRFATISGLLAKSCFRRASASSLLTYVTDLTSDQLWIWLCKAATSVAAGSGSVFRCAIPVGAPLDDAGTVSLDSRPYASGIYILVGEVKDANGKVKQDFRTKVMVVK